MNADTTTDEFNANLDPKVKTVSSQYYVWMCLIPTSLSNVKAVPELRERRNEHGGDWSKDSAQPTVMYENITFMLVRLEYY